MTIGTPPRSVHRPRLGSDPSGLIVRTCLGASAMAVVAACLAAATGRADWPLPLLGGTMWGLLNVYAIYRLSVYVRPDRPPIGPRIVLEFLLKFPVLYGAAALFLVGRPPHVILAAAVGFGIVLIAIVLRALGVVMFGAGEMRTEGLDRAS